MVTETTARIIVNAILANLSDRRGIGNELGWIDEEDMDEIRDSLTDEVLRVANGKQQ